MELAAKSEEIDGVFLLMTFPWYSSREWNAEGPLIEKEILSKKIVDLEFNYPRKADGVNKFLLAIAGDTHLLAYDTGFHNEEYGGFPVFQCSPIDSPNSCKQPGYTDSIYMNRGQFCHFNVSREDIDGTTKCKHY